ncbi:MAG: sigma factor [Gammaproteobacteria bacterium]
MASHGGQLRRFLAARVRNVADVPDIVQEVYLRMLRIPNVESIRSPEAYLFTVAQHVVQQHTLRASGTPPTVELSRIFEDLHGMPNAAGARESEGLIEQGSSAPAIFLAAGEQLTVTPEAAKRVVHPNIASATAWRDRQLLFEAASLFEVAEEFNRYNQRQLIVDNDALCGFHISGTFSSTDPSALIRFLRDRPGLRVIETPSEIRVEKKFIARGN